MERHTELDKVPDGAHDEETDADGLGDLDEFRAVGCRTGRVSKCCAGRFGDGAGRTLLGAVDELDAVLEELARHVEDLLELVGHCGRGIGDVELKEIELVKGAGPGDGGRGRLCVVRWGAEVGGCVA